jgi:hypothetical protein
MRWPASVSRALAAAALAEPLSVSARLNIGTFAGGAAVATPLAKISFHEGLHLVSYQLTRRKVDCVSATFGPRTSTETAGHLLGRYWSIRVDPPQVC